MLLLLFSSVGILFSLRTFARVCRVIILVWYQFEVRAGLSDSENAITNLYTINIIINLHHCFYYFNFILFKQLPAVYLYLTLADY